MLSRTVLSQEVRRVNKQTELTIECCMTLAALYPNRSAFKKESRAAYEAARSNGWLDECCAW